MGRGGEAAYRQAERALWASVGGEPAERFVALDSCRTRVRIQELGSGPAVVFVHGASNAGTSWAALAARLPGLRCVLVDRPGCGLSPPLGRRLGGMDELATFAGDLVVDVLDALDLADAHLVGTSFGGYFALRAAADHPERVGRLVLLGWSFGAPAVASPLVMRIATQPVLGRVTTRLPPTPAMVRALLRRIGLRGALDSGRFGAVELAWFLSLLRDTSTMRNEVDAVPRVMTLRGFAEETVLPADVLARVVAPTALLWGADDPMGGADVAERFAAALPAAAHTMLDDAGHAPWIDDPDGVAARVERFLHA